MSFVRQRPGISRGPHLQYALLPALVAVTLLPGYTLAAPLDPKVTVATVDPDGADYGPQFSPDSQRLIFERRPMTGGRAETYQVPITGGTPQPFLKEVAPVEQTRLRWSAKSNTIAFTGITKDGASSTWLMNADGTHLRPAYAAPNAHLFYPSWYADGARIAELNGDDQSLRVVTLATGKVEAVTTTPALLTGMASVAPDGASMAVAAQKNTGQRYDQTHNQIWIVDAKGDAHPLEKDDKEGRAPTWSPDGTKLLFESNRNSPLPMLYAIFVADKDGTHVRQLTPPDWNAQHPVWSPDGKWIAFSSRLIKAKGFGPGIVVMPAPTSTE
jgi:Tol biopolymer transport system component